MSGIVVALEVVMAQSLNGVNEPGGQGDKDRLDQSGKKILLQLIAEMQDEEKNNGKTKKDE